MVTSTRTTSPTSATRASSETGGGDGTRFTEIDGLRWNPASRWWGRGADGNQLEIDVVAESSDRRHLLLGEAKWSDRADPEGILAELARKAQRIPFRHGRPVHYALWLKRQDSHVDGASVITPETVMPASPGT